jgi:hypothetical protein
VTRGRPSLAAAIDIGAGALLAAAAFPLLTGARGVWLGPLFLSLREPWRPVTSAALLLMLRVAWTRRTRQRGQVAAGGGPVEGAVALLCSFGVASALFVWAHLHVRFCGGLDSYGYVSAAQALTSGEPVVPQPLVEWLPFARAIDALTPLGWTAAPSGTAIVPGYPLGFPIVMAAAILAGGLGAAFYVPLLAGVGTVALTYTLVRRVAPPWAAGAAATVVAWNPVLTNMAVQPMSDAPAAFWYLLALTLAAGERPRPLPAGLAFAMAVWTRPLVFALAPALLFLLPRRKGAFLRFAVGALPVFLAMAGMQWWLYGSPFRTGYGGTAGLFTTTNIARHLGAVAWWMASVHGPVLIAAFGFGLLRAPRRLAIAAAAGLAAGVVPYLFNMQYFDDWDLIRYLLPGLVPCVIVAVLGAVALSQALLPGRAAAMGVVAFAAAVSVASFTLLSRQPTWTLVRQESRYAAVAAWIADHSPPQALVFADLHSGSLRLYAGRPTLRWVRMPAGALGATVNEAHRRGLLVYAVFDDEAERRSWAEQVRLAGERVHAEPEAQVRGVLISRVSIGPP